MADLRVCCQQAAIDGLTPEEHYPVCDARCENLDSAARAGVRMPLSALCACGCGEAAPIAKATSKKHGWVKGQPIRYIRGHNGRERAHAAARGVATETHCACGDPIAVKKAQQCHACYERERRQGVRRRTSDDERFMAKVTQGENDCWNWAGALTNHGYGIFYLGGRRKSAHRWSYEHFRAEIPAGLDIDHLCRNRACVNPWHLEPVTKAVNSLRGEAPAVQRWREDRCARGHDLTKAYVRKDTGGRMCRECQRERLAELAKDPEYRARRAAYERERQARSRESR